MARATIRDVAERANMSVSTINRVLHAPEKVRKETLNLVLQSAQAVGFYGIATIENALKARPKIRLGFLLLQRHRAFYQSLGRALINAANAVQDHDVVTHFDFLDEPTPQNVSEGLLRLAEKSDALGVVAPEHPTVAATVEQLAAGGVRTFALVSRLTARCGVGYVGLDAWKVGRTSGWAFDNLCPNPGKIAILVGNHRFRCQETNESGFRSYFREHPRGFSLLEARSTFETTSIARDVTEVLLEENPDLVGLYVSGGGISGAMAALRDSGRAKSIFAVGYDLTEVTRAALIDGSLNFVISHPIQAMANEAVRSMIWWRGAGRDSPPPAVALPFEIYTPENL